MAKKRNVEKIEFNKQKTEKKVALSVKVINFFIFIAVCIVLGYAFTVFFFQTVKVVGSSMEQTLSNNDITVIDKISYRFSDIKQNDIVAIKSNDDNYYSIKRVVGVPGDTIQIIGGKLIVNGERYKYEDVFSESIVYAGQAESAVTLGKKQYFVIGDNVKNSIDSRYSNVGNIQETDIKGRVILRIHDDNVSSVK